MTEPDYEFKPRDCYRSDGMPKRPFTRRQAKKQAKLKGSGLKAYRCGYCGAWHLATKPAPTEHPVTERESAPGPFYGRIIYSKAAFMADMIRHGTTCKACACGWDPDHLRLLMDAHAKVEQN